MYFRKISLCLLLIIIMLFFGFTDGVETQTLLSDGFAGTTIDTDKWNTYGLVLQNESAEIQGGGGLTTNVLQSDTSFTRGNTLTIQDTVKISALGTIAIGLGWGDYTWGTPGEGKGAYAIEFNGAGSYNGFKVRYAASDGTSTGTNTNVYYSANRLYKLKMLIGDTSGVTFKAYEDSNDDGVFSSTEDSTDIFASAAINSFAGGTFNTKPIYMVGYTAGNTTTIDDVIVSDSLTAADAPSGLTAVTGDDEISLSWTAPEDNGGADITDYTVQYRTGSAEYATFNDGISTNVTTTVTGLTNGLIYDFKVAAVNIVGTSTYSSAVSMAAGCVFCEFFDAGSIDSDNWTTYNSASLDSSTLKIVGGGGLSKANADALETVSTFSRGNGLVFENIAKIDSTSVDSVVLGYGDFEWNVSEDGRAGYDIEFYGSGKVKMRRWEDDGVTAESVTATINYLADTWYKFRMEIGDTTGATFKIYADSNADGKFDAEGEDVDLLASLNHSLSGGTFTNKKAYFLGYGSGANTYIDNFTVFNDQIIPDTPTDLAAEAGYKQALLSWTAPAHDGGSSITDYIIKYRTGSDDYAIFSDGTSTSTSATVTGLTPDTAYDFKVVAENTFASSTATNSVSATPTDPPATAPTASSVAFTEYLPVVGTTLSGTYVFTDINGDSEGSTTFRWLRSDTKDGTYSAITGATASTYTLTEDDLNKYIKFEVTAVADTVPTQGTAVQSSVSAKVLAANSDLNYIVSTGQSLSIGYNGYGTLTTAQPYFNLGFSGGSFVPLVESTSTNFETKSSAMANTITSLDTGNDYQTLVTRHGVSGAAYTDLKKDSANYNSSISTITSAKTAADNVSKTLKVIAVTAVHGEADHVAGNGDSYEDYLDEWQSDYETDIQAITGQTSDIPLFTDQMGSFTGYGETTSSVPIAQLSASENNSKIYLVGPKYFLNYSDTAHLKNASYRWLGEYYGKVIKKVIVDGDDWTPLSPNTIVRNGSSIYAKLNVPETPIVIDTTGVSERTNYGFEFAEDNGTGTDISSVEILNSKTVKITLDSEPSGTNQRLRYAYTGTADSWPGAQQSGSAAGNIRDSDSTIPLYASNLYNWLVHFDKSIIADENAPSFSSVTASVTDSSASISWTSDESASTEVYYGTTESYGSQTTETDTTDGLTSHSVSLSNLSPCTKYYYQVRSKDLAQNQGTSSGNFTTGGCGGGVSPSYFNPPAAPSGGFQLLTNSTVITNNNINMEIVAGSDIKKMAISNDNDFSNDFLIPFSNKVAWDICSGVQFCAPGLYTIFVKLYTESGQSTDPLSIQVSYDSKIASTSSATSPLLNFVQDLKFGSVGSEVKLLQQFLKGQGFFTYQYITTYFGNITKTALSAYQKSKQLNVTGVVDKSTREAINKDDTQSQTTISPVFTGSNYTFKNFLIRGNTGPEVKQLQTRLQELGYMSKSITPIEIFGPATQAAVIKLQKAHNLQPPAGYVGPETRRVLNGE